MTPLSPTRRPISLRGPLTGPVGRIGLTVAIVAVVAVVFAGVLPRIRDYAEAWALVRGMTWAETLLVAAVGVEPAAAAGAVLLFRFLTWFLPIPLGAAVWLLWRPGVGQARAAQESQPSQVQA